VGQQPGAVLFREAGGGAPVDEAVDVVAVADALVAEHQVGPAVAVQVDADIEAVAALVDAVERDLDRVGAEARVAVVAVAVAGGEAVAVAVHLAGAQRAVAVGVDPVAALVRAGVDRRVQRRAVHVLGVAVAVLVEPRRLGRQAAAGRTDPRQRRGGRQQDEEGASVHRSSRGSDPTAMLPARRVP